MQDSQTVDTIEIEQRVNSWVKEFVIKLNLCPFARHVLDNESIRYKVSESSSVVDTMMDLAAELELLQSNGDIDTSLLIIPSALSSFDDYLFFLDDAERLLTDLELVGTYQLASFHPNYQFSGTERNAAENYSNRSPYPIIHILRESQVEAAVNAYGDTNSIPVRNVSTLQKLGKQELEQQLKKFGLS